MLLKSRTMTEHDEVIISQRKAGSTWPAHRTLHTSTATITTIGIPPNYVSDWAAGQDQKGKDRQEPFRVLAETIPYDKALAIRILDVGAGYGALTQFLLSHFSNAIAVCQDGSEEMAKLGRERMQHLKGRFDYVLCDFSKPGWTQKLTGPFEAVVSAIAFTTPAVQKSLSASIAIYFLSSKVAAASSISTASVLLWKTK